MVLHVRHVAERSEKQESPCLREGSVKLCSREVFLVYAKVPQCPISVRNEKAYAFISM